MSVLRCPSCGRAWDGELCFACGQEGGKGKPPSSSGPLPRSPSSTLMVGTAPAPAPTLPQPSAQSPFARPAAAPAPPPAAATPAPQFAPLPPLPPLPRAPTGAAPVAVGAPLGRPPTGAMPGVGAPPAAVPAPGPPSLLGPPNAQPPQGMRMPPSTGAISPLLAGAPGSAGQGAQTGPIGGYGGAAPAPITAIHSAPGFGTAAPGGPPSLGAPSLGAPSHGAPSLGAPSLGAPPLGAPHIVVPPTGGPQAAMAPTYPPPSAPPAHAAAAFVPAAVTAPTAAPAPRPAPIASFQNAARPAPHVLDGGRAQPGASSSAAALSAPPQGVPDEGTQEVDRPRRVARTPLQRFMHGAAAIPATFGAGFLLAFLPAALVLWRAPDAASLFAEGQYDAVISLVEARASGETPATADELVLAGHSFAALGQRDRMVKMYAAARLLKNDLKDDRIVDNLMKVLGDPRAGAPAAALLAEDWQGKDVVPLLQVELLNESPAVRHNALKAVEQRLKGSNERARARLSVARLDLKDRSDCELVKGALTVIEDVADDFPAVVQGLNGLDSEVDAAESALGAPTRFSCYTAKDVDRVVKSIAKAQR